MRVLWTRLTFYLVTSISLGIGALAWNAGDAPDQIALKVSVALLSFGVVGWMLNLLVLGSSLNTLEASGGASGEASRPAPDADTAQEDVTEVNEASTTDTGEAPGPALPV